MTQHRNEPREVRLNLRLDSREQAAIERAARAAQLATSTFARDALMRSVSVPVVRRDLAQQRRQK
jgi:uncharacterized protein (DUF1778 family)